MRHNSLIAGLAAVVLLSAAAARAQNEDQNISQEVTVQGTGFFTKDSQGNGINQTTSNTGGVLVNYRIFFNRWIGAEGTYGYDRNTLQNFTSQGVLGLESNVHQATGALVVKLPLSTARMQPYVLGGAGALFFDPTGNANSFVPGAREQTRAAFVYGAGADYYLSRLVSMRVEYRGLVYEQPDFNLGALHSGAITHTALPTVGVGFHF